MGDVIEIGRRASRDPGEEIDALAERVMQVIAHQTGQRLESISLETQIERDLGCTGDEAWMLMERIAQEFGIDMHGFDFDRHFGNERGLGWPVPVAFVVAVPLTILVGHAAGLITAMTGVALLAALDPAAQFMVLYAVSAFAVLSAMTLLPRTRLLRARKLPIAVVDLVDAARSRIWMIDVTGGRGEAARRSAWFKRTTELSR